MRIRVDLSLLSSFGLSLSLSLFLSYIVHNKPKVFLGNTSFLFIANILYIFFFLSYLLQTQFTFLFLFPWLLLCGDFFLMITTR